MSRRDAVAALDFAKAVPDGAGPTTTVAVLLHGRGSDMRDLQGLRPHLPGDWALVTPQAPFVGAAWGYGPGWAWYRYLEEDRVVPETLEESLTRLDGFLSGLPELLGFEVGRVVLGGFSQGGTTALSHALSRPGSVSAVLVFSGFLPDSVSVHETGGTPPRTPIFWGHGQGDPAIPITLATRGRNRLERAGASLVARDYRIGHWIDAEEIQDAVRWVRELG